MNPIVSDIYSNCKEHAILKLPNYCFHSNFPALYISCEIEIYVYTSNIKVDIQGKNWAIIISKKI